MQGEDAVKQVLRFASDDDDLPDVVRQTAESVRYFGVHESDRMAALASAIVNQEIPKESEAEQEFDDRRSMVFKRLRWRMPADSNFSEAGRAKLSDLRKRNGNALRAWNWINGRRTVEEIWERVQFGGAVDYETVADYLELLSAEGMVVKVM